MVDAVISFKIGPQRDVKVKSHEESRWSRIYLFILVSFFLSFIPKGGGAEEEGEQKRASFLFIESRRRSGVNA